MERIFELIAVELDGVKLGGEHWHVELLRQMTVDLPKIRPVVLNSTTAQQLDNYRRFRHLIRNIYTTNIVPSELEKLVIPLSPLWLQIRTQIETFAQYLEELSHADEE